MEPQSATILGVCYALIEFAKFFGKKALEKNAKVNLETSDRDILLAAKSHSEEAMAVSRANNELLKNLITITTDMKAQTLQQRNESLEFSKILKESIEHNTQVIKDLTSYLKTKDQIESEVEKRVERRINQIISEEEHLHPHQQHSNQK